MNWMPIETAPMDGTWILVHGFKYGKEKCVSHWYCVVQWDMDRWYYGQHNAQYVRDPKYWTYLPDIPNVSRETPPWR